MRSGNFKEMQRITSSFPFDSSNWTVLDWMLEDTHKDSEQSLRS